MSDARFDAEPYKERAIPVPERGPRGSIVLPGVKVVERPVFRDSRGTFAELWREEDSVAEGFPRFVQDNVARSVQGVVRGLHFQNPRAQGKLVTVAVGEVFDVAVDIREGSPTFGRWMGVTLSDTSGRQLYIPPGFAHAYQTLSHISVVFYKCSDFYSPEDERTIRWNDQAIAIDWPIRDAIVSPRDAEAPLLRDVLANWLPKIDR